MHHTHQYGDMTFLEIAERAREGWIAIVPTGCTEQQGPHLPVDFDTWFAGEMMSEAAIRATEVGIPALVLPAMPFGPTPEHRNYGSGYIDIPPALHDALIRAVLDSLVTQGFQRLVLWRGCGGHRLQNVVESFNESHRGRARTFLPEHEFHQIWCRLGDATVPGGHADSFATSISLYRRPESVREALILDPHSIEPDWADPALDFARYSATGVIGDPTRASAALGAELWEACVESAVAMLKQVAESEIG